MPAARTGGDRRRCRCLRHGRGVDRCRTARKVVTKDGVDRDAELALGGAIHDLDLMRKRLLQDTYVAGDQVRLV